MEVSSDVVEYSAGDAQQRQAGVDQSVAAKGTDPILDAAVSSS